MFVGWIILCTFPSEEHRRVISGSWRPQRLVVRARSESIMAMAALDGDVRKSLLDRTDAEKAFRPWWDTIEDMLLNTLIGLGKRHFTPCIMIFFCRMCSFGWNVLSSLNYKTMVANFFRNQIPMWSALLWPVRKFSDTTFSHVVANYDLVANFLLRFASKIT